MAVLAVDTSAAVTVALVGEGGERLAARSVDEQRRHAELLAPMIEEVLAESGTDRSDLTAVVAGTGPAPFTGLRVGLVTARTFALALGVPVLGVPSLDAIAAEAVSALGLAPDAEVLVTADARRREVYWARYRVVAHEGPHAVPVLETVAGPEVGAAAAVVEAGHAAGAVVVGRGAALYPELAAAGLPVGDDGSGDAPVVPDAVVLARLALARRAAGVDQPGEPLYLRRPDAQVPAGAKRVTA
ncbi:tRNA (adenosine(37)-N6)-threonylcarbamoyltransferase complex dimerization subunit type 1 TsaB [Luteimicrobium subarcticum]|uniref:tRNA threonylcarbamoyladenosine biosynthesis protein TsaB n=1 Tax=Luteimicrobium subarcticum TaxID=620910 RepID=A0A2M8WVC4_9MICO|nr:tRNA (adenosine(37)-N6)-threonylcarbamoyltransferase complex dimerization subunit type 1 TsaB [Luteimicrobium subarcticum]PJI94874.1 tRNA threonylcarbamoyladenosine biosynthesis protein TsaB [Luteimicrobium subarcticum]